MTQKTHDRHVNGATHSAASRTHMRPAAFSTGKAVSRAKILNPDTLLAPVQMQTSIQYGTGQVTVGFGQHLIVGTNMAAELDSEDTREGSVPGASLGHDNMMANLNATFPGAKFIRGHLLNDKLGGLGTWRNMFPITSEANAHHLNGVERPVKRALLDAEGFNYNEDDDEALDEDDRDIVHYEVDVNAANAGNFLADPAATLDCSWWIEEPDGNRYDADNEQIQSRPNQLSGQNQALDDIGWVSRGRGQRLGVAEQPILDNTGLQVGTGYFEGGNIIGTFN